MIYINYLLSAKILHGINFHLLLPIKSSKININDLFMEANNERKF